MFHLSLVASPSGPVADADFHFDRDVIYLGRRDGCDIELPAAAISAAHARIDRKGDGFTITDQGSVNGTRLNGVRLAPRRPTRLGAGDRLELGGFTLHFHGASAPGTPSPETPPATTRSIARRMVGEVLSALGNPATPTLRITSGPRAGTTIKLTADVPVEIGRDDGCDVALPDPDASRRNSRLQRTGEHTVVVDLASKNGTLVNDAPIQVSHTLHHGDRLLIGGTHLVFEDPTESYLRQLGDDPAAPVSPPPSPETRDGAGDAEPPVAPPAPRPSYIILAIALVAGGAAIAALVMLLSS
ncbi:MAG: FHA domain-containing protein [Deltaproteobacteria bacterium]|nr:FHA domain-containing protein [Deltaproteobacteria bacterium]